MQTVALHIDSKQRYSEDNVQQQTYDILGKYGCRDGGEFVKYRQDDASVDVLIKIQKECIKVIRRGEISHQQEFARLRRQLGIYQINNMSIPIETYTKQLLIDREGSFTKKFFIAYDLYVQEQKQSSNELEIQLKIL